MRIGIAYCPFCLAQKPELSAQLMGYQVLCRNCLASGPSKRFKKQALQAWNSLSDELDRSRQWYAEDFAQRLQAVEKSLTHHNRQITAK